MARRTRVSPIVSKSNKAGHSWALAKVRKYFPKVESVEDATQQVHIEVTPRDVSTSKRKAHSECAKAERERLIQDTQARKERADALVKVLNSMSQAVSSMAAVLDNAHGVIL